MKKLCISVLALLLALCCLSAVAENNVTDTRNSLVDIVVVMDKSHSMEKNDSENNRVAAAEMIVALADMNGSRVAFVPFSSEVDTDRATGFTDMTSVGARKNLMTWIHESTRLHGGTNFGEALAYAYNLLVERDGDSEQNNPMIILLTDGQNDFQGSGKTDIAAFVYDEASGTYIRNTDRIRYDKKVADELAEDVASKAAARGIPIYTIALFETGKRNDRKTVDYISILNRIAATTGTESSLELESKDATKLPIFFGRTFADLIGSSEPRQLKIDLYDAERQIYKVDIPILNKSVVEANIYIPLKDINPDSIELYDNSGAYHDSQSDSTVIRLDSADNFALYKIRSADMSDSAYGLWQLRFRPREGTIDTSNISLSVLYSYNIQLRTFLGDTAVEENTAIALRKSDTLDIRSVFYDLSTQTPSSDKLLYRTQQNAEDTIRVRYQLCDSQNRPIQNANGELTASETDCSFSGKLDLAPFNLQSGEYYLNLTAEGAGLSRKNRVALSLTNDAPAIGNAVSVSFTVEDAGNPGSYEIQSQDIVLTDGYVSDLNGDKLSFGHLSLPQDAIADITLDGNTLRIRTKTDGTHFAYGEQTFDLTVSDDDGGSTPLPVTVHIDSGYAIANDYAYSAAGITSGSYDKNEQIRITVTPQNNGAAGSVALLTGEVTVTETAASVPSAAPRTVEMTKLDATTLEATLTMPNYAAGEDVHISINYNGSEISSEDFILTVGNTAPVANGTDGVVPREITYHALPSALSFLAQPTDEAGRTVELRRLFSDTPDEGDLTYAVSLDQDAQERFSATIAGDTLLLEAISAGKGIMTVTAQDGDMATAQVSVQLSVVNLWTRFIIYFLILLGAILLLIALVKLVLYMNLPLFNTRGVLRLTQKGALFGTDFSFSGIAKLKKPLKLSAIVVPDICNTLGLNHSEMQFIEVSPTKAGNRVKITLAKNLTSMTVTLDNNPKLTLRTNHPLTLETGHELQFTSKSQPDNILHITYITDGAGGVPLPDTHKPRSSSGNSGAPNPFGGPSAGGNKPNPFGGAPAGGGGNPFGGAPASGGGNPFDKPAN